MNHLVKWFHLDICAPARIIEIFQNICFENGCLGIEEITSDINVRSHCFFEKFEEAEECKTTLENLERAMRTGATIDLREIHDTGWSTAWHSFFEPVQVGDLFLIFPPWEKPQVKRPVMIEINPGQAFGTGHHETTILCLEILERIQIVDSRILDIGCGSGILGFACLKLGGSSLIGLDIDPIAVREACTNAQRNSIADRCSWIAGDLACIGENKCEIVLANLDAPSLISNARGISRFLVNTGYLVISGFLIEIADKVLNVFTNLGMTIELGCSKGPWGAALISNKRDYLGGK